MCGLAEGAISKRFQKAGYPGYDQDKLLEVLKVIMGV